MKYDITFVGKKDAAIGIAIEELEKQMREESEIGVCEWKEVEKEFIQNPHTKRLYSNEESVKNNYCNTCGRKIKVMK